MGVNQVPQFLPEQEFSRMVEGALAAHGIEPQIRAILQKASDSSGNGRSGLISLPAADGSIRPVRLNVPGTQELSLLLLNGILVSLQTSRILLVALNDMDSRLRLQNDPRRTTEAGDKQPDEATGKVGDERGSQSPDAGPTSEGLHVAGVNTPTIGQ